VNRKRAIARARSYSKRHQCQVDVEHVVKGTGKGRYSTESHGKKGFWWDDSVVEIIATYVNGKKQ
jgi:hypothetical protein